jgi:uncharacterized membrane protein
VGIHVFVSGTPLRDAIAGRIGDRAFRGLFSLLSAAALVWLCRAYGHADYVELWGAFDTLRPLALLLMLFAFLLVTAGLTTPSPTAVGGERILDDPEPARGILRITRHPFLWGVALWAVTHLLMNGDAAAAVFFGSFLLLALIGPRSIDAKRRQRLGTEWHRFAALTSNVPFGAVLAGRNAIHLGEIGWWRLAVGAALYVVFLMLHGALFGVSALRG